jgi:hypothetical protein
MLKLINKKIMIGLKYNLKINKEPYGRVPVLPSIIL